MPAGRYTCSIIIPAHNEGSTIGRCLTALATATREFEVIVSCNGCADDTATVASQFPGAKVLELAVASKTAALRAGDDAATAYPRIYLDADVALSVRSVHAVVDALQTGEFAAARPPIRYVTSGASWPVRQYYAARAQLPSVMNSLWGAGCYALNEDGRARFAEFPDAVGDDLWIDGLFNSTEIAIAHTDPVDVFVPKHIGDLLKILRRAQRGKRDFDDDRTHERAHDVTRGVSHDLRALAGSGPRSATQAIVYASFAIAARRGANRVTSTWERDESSRAA